MATAANFTPAQPPRSPDWVPSWKGLYGERLRSVVHGIADPAFDILYRRSSFLHLRLHIINSPDMIGQILLDGAGHYVRPRLTQQILKPLIGNGLLSASGEDWRRQRKIVAPTFAPHAVANMAQQMAYATAHNVASWPSNKTRIDMAKVATDTTMAIIANTLFSGDKRLTSSEAAKHIDNVVSAGGQPRLLAMLGLGELDPSPSMTRARRSRRYLRETLAALVKERDKDGGGDDFFGGLMRALHADLPTDEANLLAVDNAITFYVAGHETTATALSWAIYLLAAQPTLQEEVRAEAIAALSGDVATLPDRMPILRQVLDETMRLYPSAVQIIREATQDGELDGNAVRRGDLMMIYPWVVHRHRKLWASPDAFDHTRFTSENRTKLHRFQYIPFGAGPRICVGARFAITEAMIILAHWLAVRRFSMPVGFQPIPTGTVTLRSKNGMPIFMEPL
jgi:cytochrome P450